MPSYWWTNKSCPSAKLPLFFRLKLMKTNMRVNFYKKILMSDTKKIWFIREICMYVYACKKKNHENTEVWRSYLQSQQGQCRNLPPHRERWPRWLSWWRHQVFQRSVTVWWKRSCPWRVQSFASYHPSETLQYKQFLNLKLKIFLVQPYYTFVFFTKSILHTLQKDVLHLSYNNGLPVLDLQ